MFWGNANYFYWRVIVVGINYNLAGSDFECNSLLFFRNMYKSGINMGWNQNTYFQSNQWSLLKGPDSSDIFVDHLRDAFDKLRGPHHKASFFFSFFTTLATQTSTAHRSQSQEKLPHMNRKGSSI